jgi:hypothetical protein
MRSRKKRKQTSRGITAGRVTMSIHALSHREKPNAPGRIKDPRKNWMMAPRLPRISAQIPPASREVSPTAPDGVMERQKR